MEDDAKLAKRDGIRSCYTSWSQSYFDTYLGEAADYPPVHVTLIDKLLKQAEARVILDVGCGPASMMRMLHNVERDLFGFDLTPAMVDEAKIVGRETGIPEENFWVGDATDPNSYASGPVTPENGYDALICSGVLPHLDDEETTPLFQHLRNTVKPGGLVIVEARNQLFSLFSLNRYSRDFFLNDLIRADELKASAEKSGDDPSKVLKAVEQIFKNEHPPLRTGDNNALGYDEITSNTHNPLLLRPFFEGLGFREVFLDFYHFHPLPPMFEPEFPGLFRQLSLQMEHSRDWRGYFMASAFLISGIRE